MSLPEFVCQDQQKLKEVLGCAIQSKPFDNKSWDHTLVFTSMISPADLMLHRRRIRAIFTYRYVSLAIVLPDERPWACFSLIVLNPYTVDHVPQESLSSSKLVVSLSDGAATRPNSMPTTAQVRAAAVSAKLRFEPHHFRGVDTTVVTLPPVEHQMLGRINAEITFGPKGAMLAVEDAAGETIWTSSKLHTNLISLRKEVRDVGAEYRLGGSLDRFGALFKELQNEVGKAS